MADVAFLDSRTIGPGRNERVRSFVIVGAMHGIALWLIFAFAQTGFVRVPDRVLEVFDVSPVTPPPPLEPPPPQPGAAPEAEGLSPPRPARLDVAPAPRPQVAPVVVPARPAPVGPAAGAPQGQGGGGGTGGTGTGAGTGGAGAGGRAIVAARLRGGRIEPRDYPRAAGGAQGAVTAYVAVGIDGRVTGCTVARSSGNAILDTTTCRLIRERFRFTPARNAAGEAVPGEFGWQQRWWRD